MQFIVLITQSTVLICWSSTVTRYSTPAVRSGLFHQPAPTSFVAQLRPLESHVSVLKVTNQHKRNVICALHCADCWLAVQNVLRFFQVEQWYCLEAAYRSPSLSQLDSPSSSFVVKAMDGGSSWLRRDVEHTFEMCYCRQHLLNINTVSHTPLKCIYFVPVPCFQFSVL